MKSPCGDEILARLGWNLRLKPQMKLNPPPSTAARLISSRSDFIHRRWISSANGGFNWKKHVLSQVLFWWGMVYSDHRSQWQQIYSLPPLAAREIPHMMSLYCQGSLELVIGVEPTTCWLQISCSAIEPHQRIVQTRTGFAFATGILYHKTLGLSSPFWKKFI